MNQNYSELNTLLHTLDHSFSFIGSTETWLKSYNASLYNLDGYSHEYLTRESKMGGGISMYTNDKLEYKLHTDLNHLNLNIEIIWIEIEKKELFTNKNCVIGTIYRRPGSNINNFNQVLSDKLKILASENKIIIHMGDYNIDLLKYDTQRKL
jgi:hypothetical protein